jgi:flagellar assembly protein FliH
VVKRELQYEAPIEIVEAVRSATGEKSSMRADETAAAVEMMIRNAERECEEMKESAEKKAAAIVRVAEMKAGSIKKEAEETGYRLGYIRGMEDGEIKVRAEAAVQMDDLASLIHAVRLERELALEREEKELVYMALEAAKKVMRQHCRVEPRAVSKMLQEVLLENEEIIKIYLSEFQDTLELQLDKNITKKIRNFAKGLNAVIVKERDTIMLESQTGIIDVSIPTQMEMLEESIEGT